jgi:hypothetical protein
MMIAIFRHEDHEEDDAERLRVLRDLRGAKITTVG